MADTLFKWAQVVIPGLVILTWLVLLVLQAVTLTVTVPADLSTAAYACLGGFVGFAIERVRTQIRNR